MGGAEARCWVLRDQAMWFVVVVSLWVCPAFVRPFFVCGLGVGWCAAVVGGFPFVS